MTAQWIAVSIIVPLSALYAIWQLIGAGARRRLAAWLARWPWPRAWQRHLARAASAGGACGCDGCDSMPSSDRPPAQATVRVHRRKR
jgi:hypothetical protein